MSVASALVTFTTLTLVYGVLRLWTELPSAFFSNIVAGFVSYLLNRKRVWGKSGRSSLRTEVLLVWIMSIAGMVLALFTASWARRFSNAHQLQHWERTIVILGANSSLSGSYGSSNSWSSTGYSRRAPWRSRTQMWNRARRAIRSGKARFHRGADVPAGEQPGSAVLRRWSRPTHTEGHGAGFAHG